MKRPYIPIHVRLTVALRQTLQKIGPDDPFWTMYDRITYRKSDTMRLNILLEHLFGGKDIQLDHDPALSLRHFNQRTGKYRPPANDPDFLMFRKKEDHLHKTTGRKPGAARTVTSKGSDVWLAKKYRKQANPKGFKSKIPSRPFPKGRSSFATRAGKGS
jgi:hypothetical protein